MKKAKKTRILRKEKHIETIKVRARNLFRLAISSNLMKEKEN